MAVERARTRDWWVENLLRPVLVAGMTGCFAAPAVLFLEWLVEGWNGNYYLIFVFVASLQGILAERLLHSQRSAGWGYLGSRLAELLFLLLVLKVLNYIPRGLEQLWIEAAAWPANPGLFLNDLDLYTGLLFVGIWLEALYVARMVAEIDVEAGRTSSPPPDRNSPEYYMWLTQPSVVRDRQERLDWLGEVFLWGGVVLLVAATVVHAVASSAQALAVPILLYFGLGIVLLTQAQFSVRNASWQVQGITVQKGMGRRWLVWAVVFVAGIALVALVLPTNYAMGPIRAVLGVFRILLGLVVFAATLILFALSMLLAMLLPGVTPMEPPTLPQQPAPVLPEAAGPAGTFWLQTVGSAVFWVVIVAIVVYAILRFARERLGWLQGGEAAEGRWRQRLATWLRALWRRWRDWRGETRRRRAERRAAAARTPATEQVWRFLSLRGLSPRDLIRYFYLSASRRAAQAGQARRPGQTPYEYQASLRSRFPDLEPDLTDLTDAFVEARYSRQTLDEQDAERVKTVWQRIKAALRRRRA